MFFSFFFDCSIQRYQRLIFFWSLSFPAQHATRKKISFCWITFTLTPNQLPNTRENGINEWKIGKRQEKVCWLSLHFCNNKTYKDALVLFPRFFLYRILVRNSQLSLHKKSFMMKKQKSGERWQNFNRFVLYTVNLTQKKPKNGY